MIYNKNRLPKLSSTNWNLNVGARGHGLKYKKILRIWQGIIINNFYLIKEGSNYHFKRLRMKILSLKLIYSYSIAWFLCRRVARSHRWRLSLVSPVRKIPLRSTCLLVKSSARSFFIRKSVDYCEPFKAIGSS